MILMSLWKAPDDATKELMLGLYRRTVSRRGFGS